MNETSDPSNDRNHANPRLVEDRPPSRTAMMTALGRAFHLHHYGPRSLLADWLGWPLVGADADSILAIMRPLIGDAEVPFVTWYAARARLSEDWLATSQAEQYVILGAGLDSYAWRQAGHVRVFEVDHPGSQAWKQSRVEALGLPMPPSLTWVPVDFEHDELGPALDGATLDRTRSVFVSWIGVVPFLTTEAVLHTLSQLPPCGLAVSYIPSDADRDEDSRPLGRVMEEVVRSIGESWLTMPSPSEFAALLARAGFTVVDDVSAHDIEGRYGLPAMNYERMALARKDG